MRKGIELLICLVEILLCRDGLRGSVDGGLAEPLPVMTELYFMHYKCWCSMKGLTRERRPKLKLSGAQRLHKLQSHAINSTGTTTNVHKWDEAYTKRRWDSCHLCWWRGGFMLTHSHWEVKKNTYTCMRLKGHVVLLHQIENDSVQTERCCQSLWGHNTNKTFPMN